jgi:hypothetical protein
MLELGKKVDPEFDHPSKLHCRLSIETFPAAGLVAQILIQCMRSLDFNDCFFGLYSGLYLKRDKGHERPGTMD